MLDRTLGQVWALHGSDVPALAPVRSRARVVVVTDVENLCAAIVVDVSRSGAPYAATEMFDLYEALGFLLGRVVEVLPRYDPTRGRRLHDPWTAGFKAWLHDELVRDLHDHWRSWNGRKGQKRLPAHINDLDDSRREDSDARSVGERRSRGALTADPGDRGDDRPDGLRRLLESRDSAVLREVAALGLGPDPGARGSVAGTDRRRVRAAA